jgi:hypothetical protein
MPAPPRDEWRIMQPLTALEDPCNVLFTRHIHPGRYGTLQSPTTASKRRQSVYNCEMQLDYADKKLILQNLNIRHLLPFSVFLHFLS